MQDFLIQFFVIPWVVQRIMGLKSRSPRARLAMAIAFLAFVGLVSVLSDLTDVLNNHYQVRKGDMFRRGGRVLRRAAAGWAREGRLCGASPRAPCQVLGLSLGATQVDIRKAYKRMSLTYHPDKAPGPDAEEKFNAVRPRIRRPGRRLWPAADAVAARADPPCL